MFRFTVQTTESLQIAVTQTVSRGDIDTYAQYGALPTLTNYRYANIEPYNPSKPTHVINMTSPDIGEWYASLLIGRLFVCLFGLFVCLFCFVFRYRLRSCLFAMSRPFPFLTPRFVGCYAYSGSTFKIKLNAARGCSDNCSDHGSCVGIRGLGL
jgi:hypothetical protein